MPSPKGTNKANMWLLKVPVAAETGRPLAHDELSDEFAAARADLSDPAKEKLLRAISERLNGADDQEVAGLLERLEGHGAAGEQAKGKGFNLDQEVENLARFLKGKGMSSDDIRTACDLARKSWGRDQELGVGKSARMGGSLTGSNFGGNLHSSVHQPTSPPATRDAAPVCLEEALGQEPLRGGRGDRAVRRGGGRDSRMSFDQVFGLLPVIEEREATRLRRRRSERQMGMDARAVDSFNARFPNAARIKPAY
jgi:hypothetical protein